MSAYVALPVSAILLLTFAASPRRDQEASNVPHVVASSFGRCYAKSVPDSLFHSQAGHTYVYAVRASDDTLVATYDWYSQRIFLECHVAAGDGPRTRGKTAPKRSFGRSRG
jgi:hypothetical protein